MRVLWITVVVILLDQASKFTVLRTMYPGESIPLLGEWLKLTFTENPGMAFGITFGPPGMVTVFAIAATLLIVYYMVRVQHSYLPYLSSLALILGGAVGNIIDRVFYGVLFNYGHFFQGQVVDFIHVNLWRGYLPEAIPVVGGSYLALFPIWNVADMAIVVGVVGILLFQKTFHDRYAPERSPREEARAATNAVPELDGTEAVVETPSIAEEGAEGGFRDAPHS